MVHQQKIYLGLAISAGICTGIGIYFLYRHQQKLIANHSTRTFNIPSYQECDYFDRCSSSELDNEEIESIQLPNDITIPHGNVPLTPDQALILTNFLHENHHDETQLHIVLASITNAATFRESQINLANAGCILHLRELLIKTDSSNLTKSRVLLALNNLALNHFAITLFSGIVSIVIHLCRTSPSNCEVRLYGLNLLINMSVLEYLHDEYMNNICELGLLIESTIESEDEALSTGKLLVNLSKNKFNLKNLLKMTGADLKIILNFYIWKMNCSNKSEDILLRYLTFYCNLSDMILFELTNEDRNNNNYSWLDQSTSYRRGAIYLEFFDQDKQQLAKSLLRPHHSSNIINNQMKRLYQSMDKIQQSQMQYNHENNH